VIVPDAAVKSLLLSFAYVFCLIAALVVVNIALTRLTREDREAERERRRQRKPS
jgi:membrane protein implicated in regulation of membrane protease activity